MYFKYIPRPHIVMSSLSILTLIFVLFSVFLESIIMYFFWLFLIFCMGIYVGFIMKDGVDVPSDNEFRELLGLLEKKEVIEFIRELICTRYISKLHHIGIELDLKYNTHLIQRKGQDTGQFRDKAFAIEIEKLYGKIINKMK